MAENTFVGREKPSSTRARRRQLGWLSSIVLVAAAFVLIDHLYNPISTVNGPFAGYLLGGSVSSVGGSWHVPVIRGGAQGSDASTWIGVQDFGHNATFVQVGVLENPLSSTSEYQPFWSSSAKHFVPQSISRVTQSGDLMTATVTYDNRWLVSIADVSRRWSVTVDVSGIAPGPFNDADWMQEDPTGSSGSAPYPELAGVTFSGMKINDRPIGGSTRVRYVMDLPGSRRIIPSSIDNGAFVVPN